MALTMKDIEKQFTEYVAEYIERGYLVNTFTMGGSQGEIAKIDFYSESEHAFIRLRLELGSKGYRLSKVITCQKIYVPYKPVTTVWRNEGDIITLNEYYEIGYDSYSDELKEGE